VRFGRLVGGELTPTEGDIVRKTLLIISTLLLVALLGGAAIAQNDGFEAQDHDSRDDRPAAELTLYASETDSAFITADGQVFHEEEADEEGGPGIGDRFAGAEALYDDAERTNEVGRNDITCTVTEASGEFPAEEPDDPADLPDDLFLALYCDGVVTLFDQGSLSWQGSTFFTADFDEEAPFITVAINGGTGAFNRAGGEVEIFETDEEGDSIYEITLFNLRAGR
jgi:hypothetical protein